jgi:hypothetical protein
MSVLFGAGKEKSLVDTFEFPFPDRGPPERRFGAMLLIVASMRDANESS